MRKKQSKFVTKNTLKSFLKLLKFNKLIIKPKGTKKTITKYELFHSYRLIFNKMLHLKIRLFIIFSSFLLLVSLFNAKIIFKNNLNKNSINSVFLKIQNSLTHTKTNTSILE